MEDFILCPQCKSENPLFSTKCGKCGYSFEDQSQDSQNDWLDSLRQTGELIEPENVSDLSDSKNFDSNQSTSEIPDWLKRIQNFQIIDGDPNNIKLEESFSEEGNEEITQESKETEGLDWLKEFRSISEHGEEPENIQQNSVNIDELQPEDESSSPLLSIDDIKQNWQKEFPNLNNTVDESEILPAEDLPDWLNKDITEILEPEKIFEESLGNEDTRISESSIESPDELPKWLSDSKKQSNEDLIIEDENIENSIPEWLREVNQRIDESKIQQAEEDAENISDSELLFKRLEIYAKSEEEINGKIKTNDGLIAEDLEPLEDIENKQESHPSTQKPVFANDEIDQFPKKPFTTDDEDFEDSYNLSDFKPGRSKIKTGDLVPTDEENLDETPIQSTPFSFDEIPDWLEKVDLNDSEVEIYGNESKTSEVVSEKDGSQDRDIQKANLPEWLKALRPIEVVTPKVTNVKSQKTVESAGPLAGIKGVLSTEKITNSYSTPPSYSIKIDLTDKQRIHSKLLEEIISPEISLISKTSSKKVGVSRIASILIPLIFLGLILLTQFSNFSNTIPSDYIPAETVRFHNIITGYLNQSQEAGKLLVIYEVDSSSYPEINLISAGIFENLFINNHWITTISTNPNGFIVADNILKDTKEKVPSFNYPERVINLGYLPGNYLGIQSFLSNPQLTMPIGVDQQNVWETSFLSNVKTINDFDLILLISDNTDNAKFWIEQVNLFAPEVGFLLISSTQSIPLMQPYVKSNQVDGMVGGLSGGLAFNSLAKGELNEINRFSTFIRIVAIFFIGLLLSGGLVSIFTKTFPSKFKEKAK